MKQGGARGYDGFLEPRTKIKHEPKTVATCTARSMQNYNYTLSNKKRKEIESNRGEMGECHLAYVHVRACCTGLKKRQTNKQTKKEWQPGATDTWTIDN